MRAGNSTVAVVDIGSNSIKLLVATRGTDGALVELLRETEETRIGTGISENPPRLRDDAMERAIASVKKLLCLASPFEPVGVRIVATSAVRDAVNGRDFAARLFDATTFDLAILSGREEARLIGRGIACEPAAGGGGAFHLFDLGGGSLEMLTFSRGDVVRLASLQLGCVRVTEHCVPAPAEAFSPDVVATIRRHVREVIEQSGFVFNLPRPATAFVTGGTATTFRAMRAAAAGSRRLTDVDPQLAVTDLEACAQQLASMSLCERQAIPGIPAPRADVMPAALFTLAEAARLAGIETYRHSLYNLRHGLALEMMEQAHQV